jgi:cytochrome c oxidase subunit 2
VGGVLFDQTSRPDLGGTVVPGVGWNRPVASAQIQILSPREAEAVVDSNTVLWGQTIVYTLYALVILLLMWWFASRVTREGASEVKPALFYSFAGFLVVVGVSLHIITYNTIPWSPLDMHRGGTKADKVFEIAISRHEFRMPSDRLLIGCNDKVLFDVSSNDLTYGFGLFRKDSSMVFQMQVVPGHRNDLLWEFGENGVYTIRSTEYSGPEGIDMVVPDAVEVAGCATNG